MKTIEKELKNFNFPEILIDLHRNRKTGTLTIDTADVMKKVYMDKGKAVFASSTDEDDRLGETLIKLGKITIDQYDRSVELLKETGKRQGTILVELGYLTPKDLVLGVKSQVREIIYSLFEVEYAEYEFDEGQLPKREVITLQMSMGDLIYEGMKRINNVVRIKREMPDMNAVLRLREDPENILQDIALGHRDQAMLTLIDGKKTVKELVDTAPNGTFEAMKILYVLRITGIVEEQENIGSSVEPMIDQDEVSPFFSNTEEEGFEEQVNELFSNLYKVNAHDLLGVDETADAKTVQNNYYKLVRDFHPDRYISSADPLMLDKLMAISEAIQNAYMLLKEDDERRNYFQSIKKPSQEEIDNKHAEEHIRSELSKVNEELLSSRGVSDRVEIDEKKNGESVYSVPIDEPSAFEEHLDDVTAKEEEVLSSHEAGDELVIEDERKEEPACDTKSDEPPTLLDYQVEEKFEDEAAKVEEEILSGREISVEADLKIPQADTYTEERKAEDTPESTEMMDSEPDDLKQEAQDEAIAESEQTDEVQRKRRYVRFQVNDAGVNGEICFAEEVNLVDISMSGIALKVDRRLKLGREYLLSLHAKDKVISVQAEVVRSILSESKTDPAGNIVPLYFVGMEFKNMSHQEREALAEFINSHKIDEVKIDTGRILSGTRLHARFHMDLPDKNVLELKTSYDVKVLSLCGMLIESQQAVSLNDTVQMKIYLTETESISFLGRTVACRALEITPERYEIAIEFMEMSEEDREKLKTFLDGIASLQQLGVASDSSGDWNDGTMKHSESLMEESDTSVDNERHDKNPDADREYPSQDSINLQLLNLIGEIKLLLTQLRTELPVAVAHNVPTVGKPAEREETEEAPAVTSDDVAHLHEAISEYDHEMPQEEYGTIPEMVKEYITAHEILQEEHKPEPEKVVPKKKKLKLWHILIPCLFLIAATVSFLFIYTPEKQKTVAQPVQPIPAKKEILPLVKPPQAKEESLPAAQKTSESKPASTSEVKKASAAASQAGPHTIELIASDSTWLSATIDEKASKEMILKPGDKVKWTAKNNISLVIGNAAGLKIVFDGKEISPLGGKGKVVRLKLPLSKNS
jgi:curved DNA-binding protein CbpA